MQRTCMDFLKEWLASPDRKPIVIRGARQVGKTWIVRHLAQSQGRILIEINLEKRPQLASLFVSNDPQQILLNLTAFSQTTDPHKGNSTRYTLLSVPFYLLGELPRLLTISYCAMLCYVLWYSSPVAQRATYVF
jgi:uncharacterized protein